MRVRRAQGAALPLAPGDFAGVDQREFSHLPTTRASPGSPGDSLNLAVAASQRGGSAGPETGRINVNRPPAAQAQRGRARLASNSTWSFRRSAVTASPVLGLVASLRNGVRCPACNQTNLVREAWFECACCGAALPQERNFD
jgi:hypothetical protein